MKIKAGVTFSGVQPETVAAMAVTDSVFRRHGSELIVTAITNGAHKVGSLHLLGHAFDGRSKHLPESKIALILSEVRTELGAEFDVILETDERYPREDPKNTEHFHVEFDPKPKKKGLRRH